MSDKTTQAKRTTIGGKEVSDYTMLGYFKQPSVGHDGIVREKFTWRGDYVQREYALNNRVEDTQLLALLTKFFEVGEKLSTVMIYDNRPDAEFTILLKIVKGIALINNLTDRARARFLRAEEEISKLPKFLPTYNPKL